MSDGRLSDERLAELREYNSTYIENFGTGSVVDMQVRDLLAHIDALTAENARLASISCYGWSEKADKRIAELEAALRGAEMFIENGVEYGYIAMPDDGDRALDTLPTIKKALAGDDQ